MKDDERKRLDRAARVKAMLESDEWRGAWDGYVETLRNTIETTERDDVALDARRMLRAARAARGHLEMLIQDGDLAKAEIVSKKSRLRIA